jgi:hypothetical protein
MPFSHLPYKTIFSTRLDQKQTISKENNKVEKNPGVINKKRSRQEQWKLRISIF